jgi:hypothetical protein
MSTPGAAVQTPPARRGRRWFPPLVVLGAAAVLYWTVWQLPVLFSARPTAGSLLLSRLEGGEWLELTDGVEVPARAHIRFGLRLSRPASVVLIGLNSAKGATLYVPASGSPPRLNAGTALLKEQELDGVEGTEVFLAELCNTPLSPVVILKAGERAAEAAGEPGRLQTLDLGCPEARFLLRKERPR